ncbi:MAG: DUF4174 domain-containing protein [Paracoccaceae bacterium]
MTRALPLALTAALTALPVAAQDTPSSAAPAPLDAAVEAASELVSDAASLVADLPIDVLAAWEADRTVVLDAAEVDLDTFRWVARPLVVFADTPRDPSFDRQLELLLTRIDALVERDVVIITDTDPDALSPWRERLRPRGFMMALVAKDGSVALRKPLPWDVRELSRSIDNMPLRQQEIQHRRDLNQ